ncbi:radical SAM protein [Desulfurobacterium atlanticum]|uniref:Wyosine [tRNA(Phe)-imidazoG37] synthetase, radical SAM superfamily n=1 Tax=Desulfurobacterium atlanticum TaxID=240169 RepID=A0A238XTY6_9BACT|nr:radical SAM protein [Desulfurobacterium atlanticum]SNR62516.1 Wyosine [tRNA(Phe)-imidazoG37] synthetase, radical SAM superfamily [Desulfurobacterium atlanticum]
MKYIFGPVYSRRLGLSLGVDLVPYKVCSMDCVYCEVGRTTVKTLERKEYVPVKEVIKELGDFLSASPPVDFVTFSGYGEPTLNSKIGKVVKFLKGEIPDIPIALITNSSLLWQKDVLNDIREMDLFLPSFDAASDTVLKKINRPVSAISVELLKKGLLNLKKETEGKIWLETLFVEGLNNNKDEILKIGEFVHYLEPDRWQINTVDRPPAYNSKPLSYEELEKIKEMVKYPATDIIVRKSTENRSSFTSDFKREILDLVNRRPCPIKEISDALGVLQEDVEKAVEELLREGRVFKVKFGNVFYLKGKEKK